MNMFRNRVYCVFHCDALVTNFVPMHRFPHPEKRPDLFAAWLAAVGEVMQERDHMKIFRNKRLCDHHFDVTQKVAGRRLVWNAVPTLNLNCVTMTMQNIVETDHSYCSYRDVQIGVYNPPKNEGCGPLGIPQAILTKSVASKPDDGGNVKTDHCHSDDNDEHSPNSPEAAGNEEDKIFSWQQTEYITEDAISSMDDQQAVLIRPEPDETEVSLYQDEETTKKASGQPAEEYTYRCNNCGEKIVGFRYACVQCPDWDLCGACEGSAAHATHYVLRVPGPRPYEEVQTMLETIRLQVLYCNVFIQDGADSLDAEVKEEPGAVDPLDSTDVHQEEHTENSAAKDSIADCRRKRRRLRSDSDDSVTDENNATSISDTEESYTEHDKHDKVQKIVPDASRRFDNQNIIDNLTLHKSSGYENSQQSERTKGRSFTDKAKRLVADDPKNARIQTHGRKITMATSQLTKEQLSSRELSVLPKSKVKSNRQLLLKVPPGMDPRTFIRQLQLNKAIVQLTPLNKRRQENNTKTTRKD